MRPYLIAIVLAAGAEASAQSLPFDVDIPPATATNPTEANHKITVSSFHSNGGTFSFRILTNRYAHDPESSWNNYNFIKTEEAFFNLNAAQLAAANPDQKNMAWQYFDGLGRPMQNVQGKASPDFRDIITPIEYDQYGRQVKGYLPYTKANDGRYQTSWATKQPEFYNPTTPYKGKIKTDAAPYAQTVYEDSPLGRVLQKGSPGSAWQPDGVTPANGKTVKMEYLVNADGTNPGEERIPIWVIQSSGSDYYLSYSTYYASSTLSVNVVKDEDNRQVRTYTDKQGKVIAKKIQYVTTPATQTDSHWAITYYIYDEFERLRFVLQPKFLTRLPVYTSATSQQKIDILDSLAFQYRYDERGRMIYKRVPGAGYVEMVYDQWDRLVLTRDANQRDVSGKWSFTKYDIFDRPVMTGEVTSSNTRAQMVSAVNGDPDRFEDAATGNDVGYTMDRTYPPVNIGDIFSITYYEDYSWKTKLSVGSAYDASIPSGFSGQVHTRVRNMVTGAKTRVLGTSQWLITASYYDDRYRTLQVVGDDHLGNKNRTTNEYYGITPWVTKSLLVHGAVATILTETEYDHRGRVTKVWQTMDNTPRVMLSWSKYNDLGQLVEKNIHSTDQGASFLQSNDYRYNIRGWLTHINNSALTNDGSVNDDANDLFGMELKYNEQVSIPGANTTAQFNGNISAMQWKSLNLKDAQDEKIYGFTYDLVNRLTDAKYATKNSSAWTGNANLYNEEAIGYDRNGNIMALSRRAPIDGVNVKIDELVYQYAGNRLINVHDNSGYYNGNNANPDFGFKEISHSSGVGEYTYDGNGSMKGDLNKAITEVKYNHLNLPTLVELSGNRSIDYVYDAAGIKLRKIARTNGTIISQTDYVGGLQYEGTSPALKFMITSEGRVVKDGAAWNYEYFHKDHLGNTRVVYGYMKQVDEYKATMETALASQEDSPSMFRNVNATRVTGFNRTPASGQVTSPNKSAETNGNIPGKAIGPAKMLQVGAGDRVQLEVFARYQTGVGSNTNLINNLAAAIAGAFGVGVGEAGYAALTGDVAPLSGVFAGMNETPKAYLFYALLDNNHQYSGQFGYQKVSPDALAGHQRLYIDITLPSGGYLYTYVANESDVSAATSVYFDDFSIIHTRNTSALQVVQTTDYYPFGLAINPLSYQKQGSLDNDYLYNGKELQDEHGLGWMDYGARMYMAEIGRWGVVDLLAHRYDAISPYAYCGDNPIPFKDPNGMEIVNGATKAREKAEKGVRDYGRAVAAFESKFGKKRKDFDSKATFERYKDFKAALKNATSALKTATAQEGPTNALLTDMRTNSPNMFNKLNNLKNQYGEAVDVYVTVKDNPTGPNDGVTLMGFDVKSIHCINQLTTLTRPTSEHGLNTIKVEIAAVPSGNRSTLEVLRHEFGHTDYQAENTAAYRNYLIVNKRLNTNYDGHGAGDESGKRATDYQNKNDL